MSRTAITNLLLGLGIVGIVVISLVVGGQVAGGASGFAGTDAQATQEVQAIDPDYRPWFTPLFQPGSTEVESGLFAVQAALGGVVLGFAMGALWGRRRVERAPGHRQETPTTDGDGPRTVQDASPEQSPTSDESGAAQ